MNKPTQPYLDAELNEINEEYPEHSRTSCSDDGLYNAGSALLDHRCNRCNALQYHKFSQIMLDQENEISDLKHQLDVQKV